MQFQGWDNVDKFEEGCINLDLLKIPWDLQSNQYSYVLVSHFLEHVPHYLENSDHDLMYDIVNQIIRISRHNAILEIRVPYPHVRVLCQQSHCRLVNQRTFAIFTENGKVSSGERNLVNGGHLEFIRRKIIRRLPWKINDYHFRKYLKLEVGRPYGLVLVYRVKKLSQGVGE